MRKTVALTIACALIALGGCSDDGDGRNSEAAADLVAAVERYTEAFGDGDVDTAWDFIAAECRAMTTEADYKAAVAEAADDYGPLTATEIEVDIDGTEALVTYTVSKSALSRTDQPWTLEGTTWKWTAC